MYGYGRDARHDLDQYAWLADAKKDQPWFRPYEVQAFAKKPAKPLTCAPCEISGIPSCDCFGCSLTDEMVEQFNAVCRSSYRYIADRHGFSPVQMWGKVSEGLLKMGMHVDDIDVIQQLIFGWYDLDVNAVHRWSIRYADRCPLLDTLCALDHTCEELNQMQDWLLEAKGSAHQGRTRNDVLPVLPEPDATRPKTTDYRTLKKKALN